MTKETEPNIYAYLYNAQGADDEVKLKDIELKKLSDKELLWVNILKRDEKVLREAADKLGIEELPLKNILNVAERPKVDRFEKFCRVFVISVEKTKGGKPRQVPIDLIVGKNFVLTVHDSDVDYFIEFRKREKGETNVGELNSKAFLISLLDLHIISYFRMLEAIEDQVDKFDEKILKEKWEASEFLSEMVELRRKVSDLRRWLMPHREVFHALARPESFPGAPKESLESFTILNENFDKAVDAIETARDTVLSLFELYSTTSSQRLNQVMHRLTFITLIVGTMGVIAGVLGMNFDLAFFKDPNGFWMAVGLMGALAIGLTIAARLMRWL